MILRPVHYPSHVEALFELLAEREPHQSISHRAMPTWEEHVHFVAHHPYLAWYVATVGQDIVGAVYLTPRRELGVGIFRLHQRRGYAREALRLLMASHPMPEYLANINPANEPSLALFRSLGFIGPVQVTLRKDSHA